jgi:hypothetical protein
MPEFKGLDDWIELIKVGEVVDSEGRTWNFTEEKLNHMNSKYDPAKHEAPAVVGHPKDTSPSFGWLDKTKVENGVLLGKFKQVMPEFEKLVREGRYKKRSLSLYPDMTIRHVAFLGGSPPAVKGLKDISFSDSDDAINIEFPIDLSEGWIWSNLGSMFRRLREYFIANHNVETADDLIPEYFINQIQDKAQEEDEEEKVAEGPQFKEKKQGGNMLTQEEIDKAIAKAKEDGEKLGKEKATADFSEQRKTERINTRKAEVKAFLNGLETEGKIIPSFKRLGVVDLMEHLAGDEATIDLSEGDGKKSSYEIMKDFLTELPKIVNFSEVATKDKEVPEDLKKSKMLHKKTLDFCEKHPSTTYGDAMKTVLTENPELG